MLKPKTFLSVLASLHLASCGPPARDLSERPSHSAVAVQDEVYSWAKIKERLRQIPQEQEVRLAPAFQKTLELVASDPGKDSLRGLLSQQLKQAPERFPALPHVLVPLVCSSPYDARESSLHVKAPLLQEDIPPSLFVFLEETPDAFASLEIPGAWLANLPSRPMMNYQLLAEGDFWQMLAGIRELYPQLKHAPCYLVARGQASDAALLLANSYPGTFQGLAIHGSRLGLNLPNLDALPVIHFAEDSAMPALSPWGAQHLVERLQARGNRRALSISGGLKEAILRLATQLPVNFQEKTTYTFEDYRYSELFPWLRVLNRRSERDPFSLSLQRVHGDLFLESDNVSALELWPSEKYAFPEGIRSVHYQGQQRLVPEAPEEQDPPWRFGETSGAAGKSRYPSMLVNFFRSEPLYIVYQDTEASEDYLASAKALAETFSRLDFFGFPDLQVRLPQLPLSAYPSQTLPDHRAIVIGQEAKIRPILGEASAPLPTGTRREANGALQALAYGRVSPPESPQPLKLALLLAADEAEGLQALSKHYSSATALYDDTDLNVWARTHQSYEKLTEAQYGGFWETTEPSALLLEIPPQTQTVWEAFLTELLIQSSRNPRLAISPFLDKYSAIPFRLTVETLARAIPDKHFAEVTFKGLGRHKIAAKVLASMDRPLLRGLERDLEPSSENEWPSTLAFKPIDAETPLRMVVDASALESLSPEELGLIDYRMLPYSLREIVQRKILSERERFGRELLRVAQVLEAHDTLGDAHEY